MKVLKITTGIVFFLILLQVYAYINLMVSDKYEVSLMETHIITSSDLSKEEKNIRLNQVERRSIEIQGQKRSTIITMVVLFTIFVVLLVILIRKW